jgi:hypothetical protein
MRLSSFKLQPLAFGFSLKSRIPGIFAGVRDPYGFQFVSPPLFAAIEIPHPGVKTAGDSGFQKKTPLS